MELSSLKFFHQVAHLGSISAAALEMNTVQSNVTARIKKLEDELDVALFVRQSRGMKLTTQGEVLQTYARQMIDLEEKAKSAVSQSVDDGGTLALGSMETAMAQRLPPILKTFNSRHPKTQLSVKTGTTQDMIQSVMDHKLDCAIVGSRVDHPEIESHLFFQEKLVCAFVPGAEDSRTLLVYPEGCAYRARAEDWLKRTGRLPYKIMEFGTQEGIIGCVSAGLGLTLVPQVVAQSLPKEIRFSELDADLALVQTYLICRKDSLRAKPMTTLIDLITQKPS